MKIFKNSVIANQFLKKNTLKIICNSNIYVHYFITLPVSRIEILKITEVETWTIYVLELWNNYISQKVRKIHSRWWFQTWVGMSYLFLFRTARSSLEWEWSMNGSCWVLNERRPSGAAAPIAVPDTAIPEPTSLSACAEWHIWDRPKTNLKYSLWTISFFFSILNWRVSHGTTEN